jgi:ribonuclease P/MRP protein subunit POP8
VEIPRKDFRSNLDLNHHSNTRSAIENTNEFGQTMAAENTSAVMDVDPPPTKENDPGPASTANKSTKKKRKKRQSKPHILTQITLRNPSWSYIRLQHLSTPNSTQEKPADLDAITAHQHLSQALRQFLGLHGAAIPFDILKLSGQDVYIRLAAEDRSALVAAVGGWVSSNGEGWRVKGWSSWDARADEVGRDCGQDLFK